MLRSEGKRLLTLPAEEVDHTEEWMISYSDLITLLLCFFLLFFAEYRNRAEETIMGELGKTLKEAQDLKSVNREVQISKAKTLTSIELEIRAGIRSLKLRDMDITINRRRKEVFLRLNESDFFFVGSYNLQPNGLKVLNKLATILNPFQNQVIINIEGHSDSLPVTPFASYQSNLNLSSSRASQAANVLISNHIAESRLRVVGFGSARQLVPDRQPANKGETGQYIHENGLKNRRLEIKVQISDANADKSLDFEF